MRMQLGHKAVSVARGKGVAFVHACWGDPRISAWERRTLYNGAAAHWIWGHSTVATGAKYR